MSRKWNFKVVLIGDPEVGKTSLVHKFVMNQFKQNYIATIGVNIMIKDLEIDNQQVQLSIWDVGGQEKWARVRYMYYKGASAALVVYDITNPASYSAVPDLVKEFKDSIQKEKVPLILLGNKLDLENDQKVDSNKGEEMKNKIKALNFYETSAKEGTLVKDAFIKIAESIIK